MSIPLKMMQNGFVLGRIAGITVNANQSALFLALMLGLNLFPVFGLSLFSLIMVPLIVALFLGSLLAHEFGHALTAKGFGIETEAITLHALGGVAKIKGEPRTAGQEFLVAFAGPAVSFFLAASFWLIRDLAVAMTLPGAIVLAFQWLFLGNLVLGIFNLLPGLPLDGGRVLRAIVWHFTKDRKKATIVAARVGEMIGFFFYGLAFLRLMGGDLFGALFTAGMGWFLRHAAQSERLRAESTGEGRAKQSIFDFVRTMQSARRTRKPRGFGGSPFSNQSQVADDDEEVVRLEDGREVYVRKKRL
ncbi:MAG: Zn-dependent protease [Planctomycetota bacterium]|jgi:Zn-dependent protease